jgi:hypothetical protein
LEGDLHCAMQIDILIEGSDQQQINVQYTHKKHFLGYPFQSGKKKEELLLKKRKAMKNFQT